MLDHTFRNRMIGSAMNYDVIGASYAQGRHTDPRIAAAILSALGNANSVVNVGAGTGSYEPSDRTVVAIDASRVMLAQRTSSAPPACQGLVEALPFANRSVDATMGVLTMHHWRDIGRGLAECARVARKRVVLFTWDPETEPFWLVRDYFPDMHAHNRRVFPRLDAVARVLGQTRVVPVNIPADCADGFLGAYWQRPFAYLDPNVRASMSGFTRVSDTEFKLEQLARDLANGTWQKRNAALLDRHEIDLGYRLVVAEL